MKDDPAKTPAVIVQHHGGPDGEIARYGNVQAHIINKKGQWLTVNVDSDGSFRVYASESIAIEPNVSNSISIKVIR